MKRELCSILIPTFQREKYIEECIKSVYLQTYRPIECIVVNDGSTDSTEQILLILKNRFSKEKDFSFTFYNTNNLGACHARNMAFEKSSGNFIQFLDSDDLLHPNKIELQIEALNKYPNCDFAWNPHKKFNTISELDFKSSSINFDEININTNPFIPQFLPGRSLLRKELIKKSGNWNNTLKRWQDLEYQVRLSNQTSSYISTTYPLYYFRQHSGIRINDLFTKPEGVDFGKQSLSLVIDNLTKSQKRNASVKLIIKQFYLEIFKTAIINNLKKESVLTLIESLKWADEFNYRLKIILVIMSIKITGSKITKKLLKKINFI